METFLSSDSGRTASVSLVAHNHFFHSRDQRSSKRGMGCDETRVTHTGKMRVEKNKFSCCRSLRTWYIPSYCSCVFLPAGDERAQSPNTINISALLALAMIAGRFSVASPQWRLLVATPKKEVWTCPCFFLLVTWQAASLVWNSKKQGHTADFSRSSWSQILQSSEVPLWVNPCHRPRVTRVLTELTPNSAWRMMEII